MSFSSPDYETLQKIMNENPQNKETIEKLLDFQQYTISKISHELRTPLAMAYSTYQLIEKQHPEVADFKYWEELRQDFQFMTLLLQEFSLFNNSERLRKTSFSSYDFLSEVSLAFAASIKDDSFLFTSKLSSELPDIFADRIKLQEVLLNLLKNARESLADKGAISLTASVKNSDLIIKITDTGCGIPAEHLNTLFDPFVTYKPEGTGMGLAICQRIIHAHEGNITVESEVGSGTCFIITLPICKIN